MTNVAVDQNILGLYRGAGNKAYDTCNESPSLAWKGLGLNFVFGKRKKTQHGGCNRHAAELAVV